MTNQTLTGIDIGNPAINGSTKSSPTGIEIIAGGADIWGTSDQFHFAYCEIKGDFSLTVRLEAFSKADLYSKAGIMVRESLDPGSRHVFMVAFADNNLRNHNNGGIELQYRQVADGECVAIYPRNYQAAPPDFSVDFPQVWMQLIRKGDHFESNFSKDGKVWKPYGSPLDLKLTPGLLVGLGVTSHNVEASVKAKFSGLEIN